MDTMALLKGKRLGYGDGRWGEIDGKFEKGFEYITNLRNLHLHLKGDTLQDNTTHDVFKEIVKESYYGSKQHIILTLSKPELENDFTFLTLTTRGIHDAILKSILSQKYEKLTVSITQEQEAGKPLLTPHKHDASFQQPSREGIPIHHSQYHQHAFWRRQPHRGTFQPCFQVW